MTFLNFQPGGGFGLGCHAARFGFIAAFLELVVKKTHPESRLTGRGKTESLK